MCGAALVVSALLALAFKITSTVTPDINTIREVWIFSFVVLLTVSLTFGAAIHALANHFRAQHILIYIVCASVLGTGFAFLALDYILHAGFSMSAPWGSARRMAALKLEIVAFGAGVGGATAALFWLIRRPDRDATPNPPTSTP